MGDAFFTFFWFLCNITFQVISEDKYIYNVLNIRKKDIKKVTLYIVGPEGGMRRGMGREINEILTTTSATGDVLRNFAKFTGKHLC